MPTLLALPSKPSVLVVDDNSPDGTTAAVKTLQKTHPKHLHLLKRQHKDGLGRAYLAGFAWALERDYDIICEMDADFSHHPRYLTDLITALEQGADVAIGSRYVAGGGTRNWPWSRRLISRMGSWYAKTLLNLPINDTTGGFKAFKRKVLTSLSLDRVRATGYAFQVELSYRAHQAGFILQECPIVFTEREVGRSKMTIKILWEGFWLVLWMRFGRKLSRPSTLE